MPNIDRLVAELIEFDPTLKGHEPALKTVVAKLVAEKPNLTINRAVLARLREEILVEARGAKRLTFLETLWSPRLAYAGVAVVLVLVTVAAVLPGQKRGVDLGISTKPSIRLLAANSFGEFAKSISAPGQANNARPQSGGGGGLGAGGVAESTIGKMAAPDTMMIAPTPLTVKYDYPDETLEALATEGTVYRRVRTSLAPRFSSLLSSLDLALVKLSSFTGLSLTRLEFADDKKPGYSIFADLVNGEIAINTGNYPVSIMPVREQSPSSTVDDATALQLAASFLSEHGVDTSGYGAAVVIRPEVPKGADAGSWVGVRYPLVVDGFKVYEYGGEIVGLNVSIDGAGRRVESVYGLAPYEYEASTYPLVSDVKRIIAAAERGYFGGQYFANGTNVEERTYTLGKSEMILYRNWQYLPNATQPGEYLVPALMFPVLDRNVDSLNEPWMVQKQIIVPIVADVLDQLEQPPQTDPAITEPFVKSQ